MAAPEPMNMQKPSFTLTMPHPAQPYFSLSLAQPQPSVPGPSSSAPGPSTPAPAQLASSQPSASCVPKLMHKNRLQEYAQRSNLQLPIYQTVIEGLSHAPKFRSTVWVDGKCYTSNNVFSARKAAEQNVAKLAYEHITATIKDEGIPDIFEKTMFFKSILNEFAAKMYLDKVTYHTVQQEGCLSFVSSLVFNGKFYTGDPARTKKEAEQLAARAAILSNLSDSRSGMRLYEVIKSKFRFCAALNNVKDSQHTSTVSPIASSGYVSVSAAHVTVNNNENSNKFEVALPEPCSRGLPFQQLFPTSEQEKCPEDSKLSNHPQHIDDSSSSKKRKRNKKKADEKSQMDSLPPVAAFPLNQAPPSPSVALPFSFGQPSCSVAQ